MLQGAKTILVQSGGSLTFGTSGGSGAVTFSGDYITADGVFTAPTEDDLTDFAKIYTVTATDNAGFTQDVEIAVPAKIDPMGYSTKAGGVAKTFTVTGLSTFQWSFLKGLNTTIDPTTAGTLTDTDAATVTFTPAAAVTQTTPFRLQVTNAAGDLDARVVGKTNNLFVVPTRDLTGQVYDVFQQPIVGAAVKTIDGAYTTTTDGDGKFKLTVPSVAGVKYKLRFSATGYVTRDVLEGNFAVVVLKSAGGQDFRCNDVNVRRR